MVDQRCRESEGKVKIEGYMSVSDEEAHQWIWSACTLTKQCSQDNGSQPKMQH